MGRSQIVLHLIIVSLPRTLTGPYFQYPIEAWVTANLLPTHRLRPTTSPWHRISSPRSLTRSPSLTLGFTCGDYLPVVLGAPGSSISLIQGWLRCFRHLGLCRKDGLPCQHCARARCLGTLAGDGDGHAMAWGGHAIARTHAIAHTDAHTFDLPILPLESWRFLGTTEMKMLSKMSKKQKKRRQPMLINMLKTDERFQHKAAKEPSRCLCSRSWASASLCDCAVPACRNYFTAASTRCTGRRTATVTRHSYHAKLCQQATVPCHPGGGEFGPDGGA